MSAQSTPVQAQSISGDYVLVRAGSLSLLFPLTEVARTSYLEAGNYALNDAKDFHNADSQNDTSLYMAITEQMTLLSTLDSSRFIMTRFTAANIYWCWNEMTILTDIHLDIQPIATHFLDSLTPLHSIVMIDNKPAFPCNIENFMAYLFTDRSGVND